jgi:hypothetical protein
MDVKALATADTEGKIMPLIYNPERFKLAALSKGSEKLGVASTDIDLAIDLGGRAIVYVELKAAGTPLGYAQKTLFLNLIKNSAIPAFLVVASHYTDTDEEICQNAFVEEVYWRYPEEGSGFQYQGWDLDYDGDLIPLNQFVSMLAHTFCPRLLTPRHELPPMDEFGTFLPKFDTLLLISGFVGQLEVNKTRTFCLGECGF